MAEAFYVYILASQRNGTLYIGVTNDLVRRVFEHREGVTPGFTKKHGVKMLVYFEQFTDAATAIQREKSIKFWPRQWKLNKIEESNPTWRDLYDEVAAVEQLQVPRLQPWILGTRLRMTPCFMINI